MLMAQLHVTKESCYCVHVVYPSEKPENSGSRVARNSQETITASPLPPCRWSAPAFAQLRLKIVLIRKLGLVKSYIFIGYQVLT
jgi:hypothetical protein